MVIQVSFHPQALHLTDVMSQKEIEESVNEMSDEEAHAPLGLAVLISNSR